MTPQLFVEQQLKSLNKPLGLVLPKDQLSLESEILRLLLSKKFRKYKASTELIQHCKDAIALQVKSGQPINITFLHGAYKLWRLEEAPSPDWAELFSLMYYTNWVKGICEIYEPGVHFDFFVDDLIVPELDNIPLKDVEEYITAYNQLLVFLKPYQPNNLQMTVTPVSKQFGSSQVFYDTLQKNLEILQEKSQEKLPEMTDDQKAMVELNVKVTPEQSEDPFWREKIWQLHDAYLIMKRTCGYHIRPEKIMAFTQPLPSGTTLSVGTTKTSVAKFWVGVGALKQRDDSYQEFILSPSQLERTPCEWVGMKIEGLLGKNFERIRLIK